MICKILLDTVDAIGHYLMDRKYDGVHSGELRNQIAHLHNEAAHLLWLLGAPPRASLPSNREVRARMAERRRRMTRASS